MLDPNHDEVKEQVEVEVEQAEAEAEQMKKRKRGKTKEVKPKKVVLRVLKPTEHVPATRWTVHLHRLIKEANPSLLKDPAVIIAFNTLTEVLLKHQEHVYGFGPCSRNKYLRGVNLDAHPDNPLMDICEIRWKFVLYDKDTGRLVIRSQYHRRLDGPPEDEKAVRDEVISTYRVLFDLIKADVIPYMNRMASEKEKRDTSRSIQNVMKKMERLQMDYDRTIENHHQTLQRLERQHNTRMNEYRDIIARLSRDM